MGTNTGTIMTLANSIIGVSVLAMPFCFKQCGIILSIVMLIASSLLSRLACHFLLKSAVMARRRTFEFLAFHTFGWTGKFAVELFIIGFLMGTCIAFFVVMGDLGPAIVAKIVGTSNTEALRPSVLIGLAVFVVLPLGMLKNVDSLSSVSMATIGFYICLVVKVIGESLPHLLAGDWYENVHLWRPAGILQCIPIFSMALFCQTQLFEIYESMHNASLDRMNFVIRAACNICTGVYICVGFFGYIAFCTQQFTGNVLMSFTPSIGSEIIKLGFVLSVAVSFPLVIFPCRASLYSLLFRRPSETMKDEQEPYPRPSPEPYVIPGILHFFETPCSLRFHSKIITVPHHEGVGSHIPEARFKCLTVVIISVALVIGLLIPNIELVLGIVGSTIGVLICVMFPAAAFICMSTKSSNDRLLAQVLLFVGALILVLGTYATLNSVDENNQRTDIHVNRLDSPVNVNVESHNEKVDNSLLDIPPKLEVKEETNVINVKKEEKEKAEIDVKVPKAQQEEGNVDLGKADKRQEPPIPVEPIGEVVQVPSIASVLKEKKSEDQELVRKLEDDKVVARNEINEKKIAKVEQEIKELKNGVEQIHQDAIKKEDEELAEAEKRADAAGDRKKEEILRKLEKHEEQQMKILKKQQEILEALQEHQERDLLKEQIGNSDTLKQQAVNADTNLNKNSNDSQLNENKLVTTNVNQIIPQLEKEPNKNDNIVNPKLNKIPEQKESIIATRNSDVLPVPKEEKISLSESKIIPQPPIVNGVENQFVEPQRKKQDLLQQIANGELKKLVNIKPKEVGVQNSIPLNNNLQKNNEPNIEIKESFHIVDPKLASKPGKEGLMQPHLLEPLPLQMNKKPIASAPKVEDKPHEPMNEINAMRREILQEPVANTQASLIENDERNISKGTENKLPRKDAETHDREKRDVEEIEKNSALQNSRETFNKPLNFENETNVAIESQNCQRTEKESQNNVEIDGAGFLKQTVASNLTENNKNNIIVENLDSFPISKVVPKVSPDRNIENNEKQDSRVNTISPLLVSISRLEVAESEEKQKPNYSNNNEFKLNDNYNKDNIDVTMIKTPAHLSDPDLKSSDADITVLKQNVLSSDTKPMKRDLKAIDVQEEKSPHNRQEG